MSELKECPFCGQQPKETKYREFGKNPREYSLYHCLNEGCPSYFTKPGSMTAEDWNNRPTEDALRERDERAEAMIERLIELGNKSIHSVQTEFCTRWSKEWRALVAEWQARQ